MTRRERTIRTMTIGMAVYLRTLFETLLQEVLMKRLGPQAHIINLKLNHTVPASVRLLPAKEYRGAAIGINYDLRVYTGKLRYRGEILWLRGKTWISIQPHFTFSHPVGLARSRFIWKLLFRNHHHHMVSYISKPQLPFFPRLENSHMAFRLPHKWKWGRW